MSKFPPTNVYWPHTVQTLFLGFDPDEERKLELNFIVCPPNLQFLRHAASSRWAGLFSLSDVDLTVRTAADFSALGHGVSTFLFWQFICGYDVCSAVSSSSCQSAERRVANRSGGTPAPNQRWFGHCGAARGATRWVCFKCGFSPETKVDLWPPLMTSTPP